MVKKNQNKQKQMHKNNHNTNLQHGNITCKIPLSYCAIVDVL